MRVTRLILAAAAAMFPAAPAWVMTKGEISLAIAGAGRGWDVGVALAGFTIKKK